MKSKKIWLKLCLDLAMLIVMMLLLWKDGLGMRFHEIAGMGLLAAFLIHILLNRRWVFQVTRRFFSASVSMRIRICWLLDAALLVCFVLIGISGIFMSRTLFHFSVEGNWKTLHFFCSAAALILTGAHLGLHMEMIVRLLARKFPVKQKSIKIVMICCGAAVILLGTYSVFNTSFSRWIAMPFQISGSYEHRDRNLPEAQNGAAGEMPERNGESLEKIPEGGDRNAGRTEPDTANRDIVRRESRTGVNAGAIIWKAVQYVSICLLAAMIVWGADRLTWHMGGKKKTGTDAGRQIHVSVLSGGFGFDKQFSCYCF